MSDPYIGEVRAFAFGWVPKGWWVCDGRDVPLSFDTTKPLFRVIGTAFGGDGRTSYRLPDLGQRRVLLGAGQGDGLTARKVGDTGGVETVTLTPTTAPPHTHGLMASPEPGEVSAPSAQAVLARASGASVYGAATSLVPMAQGLVSSVTGGGLPHNNLMPYLVFVYGICYAHGIPPGDEE